MEHEHKIRDRLADLEGALHDLAPAPARLDPARTLYLAGQQSMQSQRRWQAFWPLASSCLAVACITMGFLLARPTDTKIVYVPVTTSVEESTGRQTDRSQEPESVPPPGTSDQPSRSIRTELAMADSSSAGSQSVNWQNLIDRRRWQAQTLNDASKNGTSEPSPGEPAVVEVVNSRDWRLMLTDQSPGERFRTLSEPFRQATTPAMQYWTSLFPTRGS